MLLSFHGYLLPSSAKILMLPTFKFGTTFSPEIIMFIYIIVALSFSSFYGFKSVEIFFDENRALVKRKIKSASWEFHQFWVGFSSSLLGWATLFYLIFLRYGKVRRFFNVRFAFSDIALLGIAYLGISGTLAALIHKYSNK